ncbi:hypothetical protein ES708_20590 [subsurface metagenome]
MNKKFPEHKEFNLSQINNKILEIWDTRKAFQKSLDSRKKNKSFIFFEGPPSANGLPGIHHVMSRAIKDVFCRFKTMEGYHVKRKAGWDTHGLPVELSVEQRLGITKEDIGSEKISVEEYNDACRKLLVHQVLFIIALKIVHKYREKPFLLNSSTSQLLNFSTSHQCFL